MSDKGGKSGLLNELMAYLKGSEKGEQYPDIEIDEIGILEAELLNERDPKKKASIQAEIDALSDKATLARKPEMTLGPR